jgi:cytochrome P450
LDKLIKMDSFLKEAQRLTGVETSMPSFSQLPELVDTDDCLVSMARVALKDFVFSDGTLIPKGTLLAATSRAVHHDELNYSAPTEFDGQRFAAMRNAGNPGGSARMQMVSTNQQYLLFGHGKHACPGRFLAVTELKLMLSHLVLNYEVKFEKEGFMPRPMFFGTALVHDRDVEVMIRRRD